MINNENRVQLSLLFKDKKLYEDFIKIYKTERRLNRIIVACLTSYYYNQKVRELVDRDKAVADGACHNEDSFEELRKSMLVQDLPPYGGEKNSMKDISDILCTVNGQPECKETSHQEISISDIIGRRRLTEKKSSSRVNPGVSSLKASLQSVAEALSKLSENMDSMSINTPVENGEPKEKEGVRSYDLFDRAMLVPEEQVNNVMHQTAEAQAVLDALSDSIEKLRCSTLADGRLVGEKKAGETYGKKTR